VSEENLQLESELNGAFVTADRMYKGEKLAPYTEGSRLLCLQVRDEADSPIWFVWSFLYMHLLLAQDRREAIRMAWDRDGFREKLLEWISDKTEQDRLAASNLVGSVLDEAAQARVEVIPAGGLQAPPGNV
jgi:hypothetical protein